MTARQHICAAVRSLERSLGVDVAFRVNINLVQAVQELETLAGSKGTPPLRGRRKVVTFGEPDEQSGVRA